MPPEILKNYGAIDLTGQQPNFSQYKDVTPVSTPTPVPATPAPIAVSTLTAPPAPLNVQAPPPVPVPAFVPTPTPTAPVTPAPTPYTTQLETLQAELSGKTLDTAVTKANAVAPYETQLNQVSTQIAQRQAQAVANQEAVMRAGGDTSFQSGESQRVARNDNIELMKLSAIQAGLQGNIALAETHAQTALDTKYGQLEQDINTAKSNIYANYDSFSTAEKKRADATLLRLDANDAFVKQSKADDKSILDIMLQAAQNGADSLTLNRISNAKTPEEATTLASKVLGAKFTSDQAQQTFDNNIKLAELALEQKRLSNDTSGITDPAQIVAYAQQYATDGKIPTGLPKGSFGVVAQVAKELPKPEGTLVSNATGVASNNLSSTQTDGITALYDLQKKLDDAKALFQNYNHGVLAGIKNAVAPSQQAQQYNDLRLEISDLLARARTGAAINTNEERIYNGKLPGNFNESFFLGNSGTQKIDDLKASLGGKLQSALKINNASIYGYSKVKLGDQEYTVGTIITNSQGQQGRVNADGSITLLQ